MISRQRTSARQQEPSLLSTLATVPEPITVPAISERDLAQCEIKVGKSKVISLPALGAPIKISVRVALNGKCNLAPSHASPNSSGVTRTGVKLAHGFEFAQGRGHFLFDLEYGYNAAIEGKPRDWARDKPYALIRNPAYRSDNSQPQYITTDTPGLSVATRGGLIIKLFCARWWRLPPSRNAIHQRGHAHPV